ERGLGHRRLVRRLCLRPGSTRRRAIRPRRRDPARIPSWSAPGDQGVVTQSGIAVLKVGGSLLDWPELPVRLAGLLEARLSSHPQERPVLIAGGGGAADLVRVLDRVHHLGDSTAHELAIQALDFTARLLAALLPRSTLIDRLEALGPVWVDGG